jgi:hypothetical protein
MAFVRFTEVFFETYSNAPSGDPPMEVAFDADDVCFIEARGDKHTSVEFYDGVPVAETIVIGSLSEVVEKVAANRSKDS